MHMMTRLVPIALAAFALTGCGKADDRAQADAVGNFTPPAMRAPKPMAGQAQTTPITAYVGKYPHDAVGGVDFFDRTEVANALIDAVGDDKVRTLIRTRDGPETPIFRRGPRVAAWGCEQHNCGDHNWMFAVAADASQPGDADARRPEACYHDADIMGDRSRWYGDGGPTFRPGSCPSEG